MRTFSSTALFGCGLNGRKSLCHDSRATLCWEICENLQNSTVIFWNGSSQIELIF